MKKKLTRCKITRHVLIVEIWNKMCASLAPHISVCELGPTYLCLVQCFQMFGWMIACHQMVESSDYKIGILPHCVFIMHPLGDRRLRCCLIGHREGWIRIFGSVWYCSYSFYSYTTVTTVTTVTTFSSPNHLPAIISYFLLTGHFFLPYLAIFSRLGHLLLLV